MKTCMYPLCGKKKIYSRGACRDHYLKMLRLVRNSIRTWTELESAGYILPAWFKDSVDEFLRESNAIEGVYDAVSFRQAQRAFAYLMKQEVLSQEVVLKTHKILMQFSKLKPCWKGHFREQAVWIAQKEALPFGLIEDAIGLWCFDSALNFPGVDTIAQHVEYEKIHPFIDGNGRTGRMFMNWQRLKQGEGLLTFRASERGEYYKLFH